MAGDDAADGVDDALDLRARQRIGDCRHSGFVQHVAIGTDDAREPLTGEFTRHRPSVGRRHRVVRGIEITAPDVDVTGQGKPFRRDADGFSTNRHVARHRFDWRPERARVNKLA